MTNLDKLKSLYQFIAPEYREAVAEAIKAVENKPTKEVFEKVVNDIMDTKDFEELMENCRKAGLLKSSFYSFAMAIGEKVCDD